MRSTARLGSLLIAAVTLSACAGILPISLDTQPLPTQPAASPTVDPPTPEPTLTATPSVTPSPTRTPTPTPSPTPAPTATPTPPPEQLIAAPGTAWNFELVGHHAIETIGWHGSLALKDRCAYVGNYRHAAIAIVDVADPAHPALLESLGLPAGTRPVELRTIPDLDLLVVADLSSEAGLFTYNVSDCATPQLLGSMTLAQPANELYLWHDGARVLAFIASFDDYPPDLTVVELTDPAQPREVARWSRADENVTGRLHSLSVSQDGTRAYLALWHGGFLVADVDLPQIRIVRGPDGGIQPARFPNTHSAVPLEGSSHVLLTSEMLYCPFEGLAVADVSDPAYPEIVATLRLPENRCEDLPDPPDGVFTSRAPLVVGDVAVVSWYAAGLQAVDLSDPTAPARLGQFVPEAIEDAPRTLLGSYPVQMVSYPIVRDGLIYATDAVGGLYFLRYTGPRAEALAAVTRAEANVTVLP